ncbi:SDR family NAD(P)-dependent oxidoreductase [Nesterenkonia sp. YGD6]|uniref:SDR family NAD(P)-dependent oxidoreductase n=1 Tax=Nesterenkonia sp. YGD6 TaxID=2901231 RepID=UPI00237AFA11|nr:SDR family oxidoreductase [Nesterenkonia sp. YGD6]
MNRQAQARQGLSSAICWRRRRAREAQAGRRLSTHMVNIVDREAVDELPGLITQAHGPVDGLINVAGIIQPSVPVEDLDLEVIERVLDVNFWGTLHMVKAFLPGLKARPEKGDRDDRQEDESPRGGGVREGRRLNQTARSGFSPL